jgi:hypothetical protein
MRPEHGLDGSRRARSQVYAGCACFAALLTMRVEAEGLWPIRRWPIHVRDSFPDAEVAEDHFKDVFDIDAAGEAAKPGGGEAELLRDQFLAGALFRQLA